MSWVAAAIGGSAVLGFLGSRSAAKAQTGAAKEATASQERMFNKQLELQEPFRQGGLKAQNRLLDYMGLSDNPLAPGYGKYAGDFGMSDFVVDPGYHFRLSEGLKALDKSAAARGLLQSGGSLRGAVSLGQKMGSDEFQNAFNRYQINRGNQINPLLTLFGAGQTATNQMGADAGTFGRSAAENAIGAGNARASGYMGMANAGAGAAGQYVNYRQGNELLAALRQGGYPTTGGGGGAVQGLPPGTDLDTFWGG